MSIRRLMLVARQELSYTCRRPSFWIMLALIGLIVWGLSSGNVRIGLTSGDSSVGGKKAFLTSEFALAQLMVVLSFLGFTFFAAVMAGLSVPRDLEWKTGEILHATPLTSGEYIWGKFTGVFLAFLAALVLTVGLVILIFQVMPNSNMLETRGPFHLHNYVVPAVTISLPIIMFTCGTSFGVGAWTRKPILVFVLPIMLLLVCGFFFWSWTPAWLDPRIDRILMLVDPSGFRWLNQTWLKVDRGVDFYNTQRVVWDSGFVWSRFGVAVIGIVSTVLAAGHFGRTLKSSGKVTVARRAAEPPAPGMEAQAAPGLAALRMRAAAPNFWRGFRLVAGAELKELRSSPGLYLFIPLILQQTLGNALLALGAFDTPLLVTSGTLAVRSMSSLITLLALLIVFYAVESLERERATGFSAIHDALPVHTGSILAGKAVALAVVAVTALLATFVGCAIAMAIQGRVGLELKPFLLVWVVLLLPGFVLWTCFVFAIYAIVKNRYTTYSVALVTLAFTSYLLFSGKMNWVGNWPLWGALRWSDISVFEIDRTALILNRLFWLSLALVFLRMAIRWFPRRALDTISTIHALQPARLWRSARGLLPWLVAPLFLGGALWRQIDRGPDGARTKKIAKDYWRKNLATWTDAPAPALADVDMALDLNPRDRAWSVKGTYIIVNKETVVLSKVPITVGFWNDMRWTINGQPSVPDTLSHLYVFTLAKPLAPGDSVRLGFTYNGVQPGATKNGGGAGEFILPSGVVMTSFGPRWFPFIGYLEEIGVDDENRAEPKQYPDDFYKGITPPAFGSALPMTVHMAITAPADFTANSVGERISEEVNGATKTTVWHTDHPVMAFNVIAGRYVVKKGEGTALYYNAAHTYNVAEMSSALDAARKYYGEWFAPFPWRELKISEFPGISTYAQGFPTNITFSESIGFLTKSEPKTNLAFLVVAHESAHQWWGNMLQPGRGPSGNLLSEGMAHFSTALLMAQVKGQLQGMEFRKRIESRYAESRHSDAERSLLKTDGSHDGDGTLLYDKGGWTFWMLWNLMGSEQNFAGLRTFIASHLNNPDHAVLADFVEHMRQYAPDTAAYDAYAKQWFASVVVPEYRLSEVRSVPIGSEWETTARLENIGTGRMPVEVAVTQGERSLNPAEPVKVTYRASGVTVVIGSKEIKEVRIRSPFKPARVVVDPDVKVLQLRRTLAENKL